MIREPSKRVPKLLLGALAVGAGVLVWWLAGPGTAARPAGGLEVPALRRAPEPDEVLRLGTPPPAGPVEVGLRAPAAGPAGALGIDISSATWVEGKLVLPPGTPADERPLLLVASFGPEPFETGSGRPERGGARPGEMPCELEPDGSFRAPVHPAAARALLRLEARYLYLEQPVEIDLAQRTAEVRPTLGAWLTGRFVPPAGSPPGTPPPFEVRLRTWSALGVGERLVRRAEVADDLSFEFGGVPTGRDHTLMADPGELAAVTELSLALAPGQHRDGTWPLMHGARIAGRVVDQDGAPLVGALVRADAAGLPHVVRPERSARTDERGGFVIDAVSPGRVTVLAEQPGLRPASTPEREVADREVVEDLVLRLERGEQVAGRVSWPDGAPAAGARVAVIEKVRPSLLSGGYDRRDREVRADAAGRFALAGLGPGPFVLRAAAAPEAGAAPWRVTREGVRPGEDAELVLRPSVAISGRVVDERLEPVPEFTLRVSERRGPGAGEGSFDEEVHALRDPDGVFHLDGLGPGTWELAVQAGGHAGPVSLAVRVPEEPGPFLLTLPRAGAVAGTVLDPAGVPVPGAEVDFEPLGAPRPWHLRPAVADGAGRFELTSLPPGVTELLARHADWAPAQRELVDLPPGARLDGVRLTLRPSGRLTGEVYREDGSPDAERELLVLGEREEDGDSARADARGRFELGGLAPGDYVVVALDEPGAGGRPPPAEPVPVSIAAGETAHVVLGLPASEPVRLTGRVLRAGRGLDGARVAVFRAHAAALAQPRETETAADGEFALELDGPGQHLFVVSAADVNPCEFPALIPRAAEHRLDLSLPAGRIHGRVLGPEGAPVARARVACSPDAGARGLDGPGRGVFSDEQGAYELSGLRPGGYTLRAGGAATGVALRAGLLLADGEEIEVDLELPRAGTLLGTVRDELGRPAPGASVFVRSSSGLLLNPTSRTRTDAAGRFEYSGCAPGDYTVCARRGDSVSVESEPVPVAEGQSTAVELLLEPGTRLLVAVEDDTGRVPARVLVSDRAGREVAAMESSDDPEAPLAGGTYATERWVGPLPPGVYTVLATYGERTATRSIEVSGPEVLEVILRL